jgi:hypothetical protein
MGLQQFIMGYYACSFAEHYVHVKVFSRISFLCSCNIIDNSISVI